MPPEIAEALNSEDQTTQFEDDSTPEEMTEAQGLGWKSPAEWKGDPPKNGFKKAKDFLEHGRTVLPIVRSENAALKRELSDARKELSEFKVAQAEVFENVHRMSRVALTRQREQLKEHYEAVKEAAVEVGDKDAYRKASDQQEKALDKFDEEIKEKKAEKKADPDQISSEVKDTIDGWVADNRWYDSDEEMKNWALGFHAKLQKEKPGLTLKENLAEVSKRARKKFPEAFGETEDAEANEDDGPKARGSRVEGGSRVGGGSQRSGYSSLPSEAKKAAVNFVDEQGLFFAKGEDKVKDRQKALERYAKDYWENEA